MMNTATTKTNTHTSTNRAGKKNCAEGNCRRSCAERIERSALLGVTLTTVWLAVWLAGWLAGWLADWLALSPSSRYFFIN